MKIELILFDLDDTLMAFDIVSETAWEKAVDIFLQNQSINIERDTILEIIHSTRKWHWADTERHKAGRKNIAHARREIVKLALNHYLNIETNELEKLANDYTRIHETL
jgi:beta-phosphoglucomutase-like phosphatase (HAD superfamily)